MYDIDIREAMFDYLDDLFIKYRILEEKTMGKSRADLLMVIDGSIIGFEIKSDSDTYERLKRQTKDYDKYCNMNYIVVGKSHEKHVEKYVPKYWGIYSVALTASGYTVDLIREAIMNPRCKIQEQLKWLWKEELGHILAINKMPKYKQKSKKFIHEKLLEKVEVDRLMVQMTDELFERDYSLLAKD